MLVLALVYAIAAVPVLRVFASNNVVSVVWPSSGIALAALLLLGWRYWPGVLIGGTMANMLSGAGSVWWVSAGIGVGNTIEGVLACWLLQRAVNIDVNMTRPRDFLWLASIGAVASLASAVVGVSMLYYASYIEAWQVPVYMFQWWQGDVLGIDLVAPLILIWQVIPKDVLQPITKVRLIGCFGLAFLCGQSVFNGWFDDVVGLYVQDYWLFIFIIWCAIRFGRHGVSVMLLMIAAQYLSGILRVYGYDSMQQLQAELTNFWIYMLVMTLVGMALAQVLYAHRQDKERLRESDERWHFAIEGAGDGVWDWDIAGEKVHLTPQFRALYGFDPDYIGASPQAWSVLVHPDDMPAVLRDFDQHLQGKVAFYRNEHRNRCSDGSYKWILDRGLVIRRDEKGKPLRMVGTHTDITLRKLHEHSLQQMNDELEKRVAERTAALEAALHKANAVVSVAPTADTSAGSVDKQPLLNPSALLEGFAGDKSIVNTILQKFMDMTVADVRQMNILLAESNLDALCRLGHKLKSSARQVGAPALGDVCEALEKTSTLSEAAGHIARIETMLSQVGIEVTQYLAHDNPSPA